MSNRRASALWRKERPLIGIPTLTLPGDDWRPARFGINQSYVNGVYNAGGLPVLLPLLTDKGRVRDTYERLDGLLLPGGADLDGNWYGGKLTGDPELERDVVELELARWAYKDEKPTLGICRGQQVMNVLLGGTLYQDLGSQRAGQQHTGEARRAVTHGVAVDSTSRLGSIVRDSELMVNSLHHQAVDRIARHLLPTAYADDRLIEGLESPDHRFWLSVQWHPEELCDEPSQRLFAAFVTASADSVRRS